MVLLLPPCSLSAVRAGRCRCRTDKDAVLAVASHDDTSQNECVTCFRVMFLAERTAHSVDFAAPIVKLTLILSEPSQRLPLSPSPSSSTRHACSKAVCLHDFDTPNVADPSSSSASMTNISYDTRHQRSTLPHALVFLHVHSK